MEKRPPRSASLVVRMLPELRERIERDARARDQSASSRARRVLAEYYEDK